MPRPAACRGPTFLRSVAVELQRLHLPRALLANPPDAASHEEHTDDRERRPAVGPDQRQRPRQPADDEDETQDDAAHAKLLVEGAGMIRGPPPVE